MVGFELMLGLRENGAGVYPTVTEAEGKGSGERR